MTAIILSAENVQAVKRSLRNLFPELKSSHLSEALAAAVGRRTHASLLADLEKADPADPEVTIISDEAFIDRATEFGFNPSFGGFDGCVFPTHTTTSRDIFINTSQYSGDDIKYASLRDRAWRNMMVGATNAAIAQKLISVRPGDNRWPGAHEKKIHVFSFEFGDKIPALASLYDAGFDEISIKVALWPTEQGAHWVEVAGAGFLAGGAFGSTWLERTHGAYLQTNTRSLKCRKHILRTVADANIKPKCFGDRGQLIL